MHFHRYNIAYLTSHHVKALSSTVLVCRSDTNAAFSSWINSFLMFLAVLNNLLYHLATPESPAQILGTRLSFPIISLFKYS